jgi:transposase
MSELHIVGVDLAKRVFQVHGACNSGYVKFRKKLTRSQFEKFLAELPPCIIAMEACSTAHYWGRLAESVGHEVRLIPAIYVKPFAKRHKSDVIDAEAIAEAAIRPSMRFVAVKSTDQQAQAVIFRSRELLLRQRTQLINALRGHLAEFGVLLPKARASIRKIMQRCESLADELPTAVRNMASRFVRQIEELTAEIAVLDRDIKMSALRTNASKRLQTMPGVGPITAMAIQAFCPPPAAFRTGRDFAAWLGLVPRQHSTGGKERLGRVTKMGQSDVRRLLVTGAMSVIMASEKTGRCADPWLENMLAKKPRMVVAVALANRMARRLWAMMAKERDYEIRASA